MRPLYVALVGLLAGVLGTSLGGVISVSLNLGGRENMSFLLAASGGAMLSISMMELIPEAIETGSRAWASLGLLFGTCILFFLDLVLPHVHHAKSETRGDRRYHGERRSRLVSMGVLIGLGIAMHNLPEGLAIGAAYVTRESLGLAVAFLIGLHNIPEGMAMAVPLNAGGMSPMKALGYTMLAGIPMGVGAWIGAEMGAVSPEFLSVSFGIAAGAMMYVVSDELIPEAHQSGREQYPTLGLVVGMFLGIVATFLL